ncbi:MAG: MFS transporter [Actinomycetales bacterium]|nr:MFS transporter [Actinomycetales bacterium]
MKSDGASKLTALRNRYYPEDPKIRTIALALLINTFGNGLFGTLEVIYFTRVVGLTPAQIGLGLSIAGGISLLFSIPAGQISDRFGPRNFAVASFVLEGLLTLAIMFVHSFAGFVLVATVAGIAGTTTQTFRMATIARIGGPENAVQIRAFTRTVVNFGIGLGTVFAGIALSIDTLFAYNTAVVIDAVTFFLAAAIWFKLPVLEPTVERGSKLSFSALRDRRYLLATASNGFNSLHFMLQGVALPLWVIHETTAPRWMVATMMVVNTVCVVLFQMSASKGSEGLENGARLFSRASLLVALACVIYAGSHGVGPWVASIVLLVATLVHVAGELYGSAGSWSIGFGLADQSKQGEYQGVWSLGMGIGGTVGPAFVTAMVIGLGQSGWILMASLFVVNGLLMKRNVTGSWHKLANQNMQSD